MLSDEQILEMIQVQQKKAKKLKKLKEAIWQFIEANEEQYVAEELIYHLQYLLKYNKEGEAYPNESMDILSKDIEESREDIKAQALESLMIALKPYFALKAEVVLRMWLTLGAPKMNV